MRFHHLALALMAFTLPVTGIAQQPATAPRTPPPPPPNSPWRADPADVGTLDAIMKAVYDVISGPAGGPRNWNRMRSLFVPGARLGPAVQLASGQVTARIGTLDEWIAGSEVAFAQVGFFEKELARRSETFGRIAHVFSTYGSWHSLSDPAPFQRGINSIQLLYDGVRWWVVSIYWDAERPDNSIPDKYLQTVP